MPDINKTSVREELDRLKTDFQKQSDAGIISEESRLLIQSLFTLLNLIVAIFLEKTTTKTNKNSSKPSSQTDKDDTALSSPGSKKKGKIEKNARSKFDKNKSKNTFLVIARCPHDQF